MKSPAKHPPREPLPAEFATFLRNIEASKTRADEILEHCKAEDDLSRATLVLVWQKLFDRLSNSLRAEESEELKPTIDLIQRLYASTTNRKATELKTRDDHRKAQLHKLDLEKARAALHESRTTPRPLTAEEFAHIEKTLHLL